MGERRSSSWLRTGGAVIVALGAAVALSSCSLLQVAPSPTVTPSPHRTVVTDPSIPSSTPYVTATPPPPSPKPVGSPTPTTQPTVPGSRKRAVSPFVTLADWNSSRSELDVSAIVPGIVESGGTCTATVTKGGITRTVSAPAAAAPSYVGCNPMIIRGSALSAGTWTVRVSYASHTAEGTSAPKSVQVPG